MNAANVVVCPSEREGFGLAPLEALACDVPVIATPVGDRAASPCAASRGPSARPFDVDAWADARQRPPRRTRRPPRRGTRSRLARTAGTAHRAAPGGATGTGRAPERAAIVARGRRRASPRPLQRFPSNASLAQTLPPALQLCRRPRPALRRGHRSHRPARTPTRRLQATARSGARERSAMRRRARKLRRLREAVARDLGLLVLELQRRHRENPELLRRRTIQLRAIDDELRGLGTALGRRRHARPGRRRRHRRQLSQLRRADGHRRPLLRGLRHSPSRPAAPAPATGRPAAAGS